MKPLLRFAAALAVACLAAGVGGPAAAEDVPIGKCHRVYSPAPGGDEPVEIVVCP